MIGRIGGSSHTYRFGIIAEAHLPSKGQSPAQWHNPLRFDLAPELLSRATTWCGEQQADAIVLLGDLTHTADDAAFDRVVEVAIATGRPVIALPGNHDVVHEHTGLQRFQERVDREQVTAAPSVIESGVGVRVIGVGLEWDQDRSGFRSAQPPQPPGDGNDLAVVLSHYPLLPMAELLKAEDLKHAGDLVDRDDLADDLRRSDKPTLAIHGHLHVHAAMISGPILHLSSAALIEPPHHASVVTITHDQDGITVERNAVSMHQATVERMPIISPIQASWRWSGESWHALDLELA